MFGYIIIKVPLGWYTRKNRFIIELNKQQKKNKGNFSNLNIFRFKGYL